MRRLVIELVTLFLFSSRSSFSTPPFFFLGLFVFSLSALRPVMYFYFFCYTLPVVIVLYLDFVLLSSVLIFDFAFLTSVSSLVSCILFLVIAFFISSYFVFSLANRLAHFSILFLVISLFFFFPFFFFSLAVPIALLVSCFGSFLFLLSSILLTYCLLVFLPFFLFPPFLFYSSFSSLLYYLSC